MRHAFSRFGRRDLRRNLPRNFSPDHNHLRCSGGSSNDSDFNQQQRHDHRFAHGLGRGWSRVSSHRIRRVHDIRRPWRLYRIPGSGRHDDGSPKHQRGRSDSGILLDGCDRCRFSTKPRRRLHHLSGQPLRHRSAQHQFQRRGDGELLRRCLGRLGTGVCPGRCRDGSIDTQPISINDYGSVTGNYIDASGVFHGFVLTHE